MATGTRRDDATIVAGSPGPGARGGAARAAPDRAQAGARFFGADQRYQVTAVLGRGGFGTVYKAYDHRLAKYVAVKTINISDIPERERADYLRAFDNEAKIAAQLEHPGVVTVIDYDPYTEEPYLVMPLVECGTLKDWFAEHPRLPWPQVVELGVQVAEALEYAYRHGVHTHRDIKPANIFCAPDGRYKLGDFGIARRQRMAGSSLTRTAFFAAGTPRYMAPEQIVSPRAVDSRADLFALCVVLYEALTGKQPFRGVSLEFDPDENPTSAKKIVDAAYEPPEPIRKLAPDVPAEVARIIERGLARDPRDRYASAGELAQALKRVDLSPRAQVRQIATRLAGVALVACFVALVVYERRVLWNSLRDVFGVVAGHSSALLSRVNVDRIDPGLVERAQRRAREARAAELAAARWGEAEAARQQSEEFAARRERSRADDARQKAIDLYERAEREAWSARLKSLAAEVETARQQATTAGIVEGSDAAQLFAAAEESRRRANSASGGNPAEASKGFEAALASYKSAIARATEQASGEVARRLEAVKAAMAKIPSLSDLPRDLVEEIERTRQRLRDIEEDVRAGRADAARGALTNLDGKVHELVVDTTIALRRHLEKQRSEGGAGLSEAARRRRAEVDPTFNRAVERLASARSTEEYFAVLAMLEEVRLAYEGQRRSVASDEEAVLAAAEALRGEAEAARADLFPRARLKFEKGLKQLADARHALASNPRKASELAKSASISFVDARDWANQEAKALDAEVPAKRAAARKARAQAEKAGAARDPRAGEAMRKAAAAMDSAEETVDTTPAALTQRVSAYEEAARWFAEAEQIALAVPPEEPAPTRPAVETAPAAKEQAAVELPPPAPPRPARSDPELSRAFPPPRVVEEAPPAHARDAFEVRQRPPADHEVLLARGEGLEFWADTRAKGASFTWYFNGKELGSGFPGIELEAPGSYPDGLYKLIVRVVDAQGREVTREWTVRVVSPP